MKTYKASCHCGSVKFEVKTDLKHSAQCDCSLCIRRGTTMVRCDENDLKILSGEEFLSLYQFNTKVAKHYFCQHCGVCTFHKMRKFPDIFAVNAGCLEAVNPFNLKPTLIKGSKV